jgi:isocitrate dehydrogenase
MAQSEKLQLPSKGRKITFQNNSLNVPDDPIIPFIAGDGMGPDIWNATKRVIDAAVEKGYKGKRRIEWLRVFAGLDAMPVYGKDNVLPDDTVNAIREYVVAIKGPLTTPVGGHPYVCMTCAHEQGETNGKRPEKCLKCGSEWITKRFRSMNVTLRQKLDLYACVRPVKWIPGVPSPVKEPEKLDIVIFRENTEDVYAGIEFEQGKPATQEIIAYLSEKIGKPIRPDSGIGIKPISVTGTRRIVEKALRFAIEQKKPSVTLVHKGNIMKFTEGAFRDWGYVVAKEKYADQVVTEKDLWDKYNGKMPSGKVLLNDRIADSIFQQVLLRPGEYSVLCTPNLNGDYLSDACAAQVGGLGMAPGSNIGESVGLFEATHGTAPKYTGLDKVNPGSLILSGVLMLQYMRWNEAAALIEKGLAETIRKKLVTYDLERQMQGAKVLKTSEFGTAIIENM